MSAVLDSNPPGLQKAIEAQERHTQTIMTQPGVVGTAIGLRGDGKASVFILTEGPLVGGLPDSLDGVPVQVRVTGKIYSRHHRTNHEGPGGGDTEDPIDPTTRFDRPVPIGVSTGHPSITAGTYGARVTDGSNVYALSNNHVYANENLASIDDPVIQPGTFDGGASPADDIGTLSDFEPIDFLGNNTMDAAIALSSTVDLGNSTPSDGYGTPKSTTAAATLNMKVKKYGRTTGFTKGQVYLTNATVSVGYDTGVALFVGQIIITPGNFSAPGDSGSLIVVDGGKGRNKGDDRKPVGLLFAGSSTITIASPIDPILTRFGVTVDGD
ncbi:hypothetical protein [Litoribacillus peritrichatus]|uniref:Uncharacterized protein n=1 Tax=Litoribacillus peritrichatus TaxID=718191 RepID=A0ABP7N5Z3_9GAMM